MPFKSQAQRAFMYANHPQLARRWEAVTPKGQRLPKHDAVDSRSEESPNPKIAKLPRKSGMQRDFGGLKPNAKARHKESHPANEPESMEEKPLEASNKGERGKLKLGYRYESRLQGRDIKRAERSR